MYMSISKPEIYKFFKDFDIEWKANEMLCEYLDSISIVNEF